MWHCPVEKSRRSAWPITTYHSNALNFRSSQLEETESALASFRWCATSEIKPNITLDIAATVPGLNTLKQLNELTDKQIWDAIGESSKKKMGTSRRCCNHCDKSEVKWEGHKLCSRCKNACYCSKECQQAHWKAGHKKQCIDI